MPPWENVFFYKFLGTMLFSSQEYDIHWKITINIDANGKY